MQGEPEGEEPEFADAGPGEDAPCFVALAGAHAHQRFPCHGQGRWAHNAVDVGLDVPGRDLAVFHKHVAGLGCELVGEDVVVPGP